MGGNYFLNFNISLVLHWYNLMHEGSFDHVFPIYYVQYRCYHS